MGFYYPSLISLSLLLLFYIIGTVILVRIWGRRPDDQYRVVKMAPLFLLLYLAPISEELWIAWNFGQLCRKDAGIFVNKTVKVDGFYDSTMRSAYEITKEGRYLFVEQSTEDRKGIERVRLASNEERTRALAWYAEENPAKERPKDRSIFYPINDKETVAVLPNGVDAWLVTRLERPTARYHYRRPDTNASLGHKLTKFERVVTDSQTGELLGRETKYGREAPWLHIGLGRPILQCPAPGESPLEKHGSVFNLALIPYRNP